MNIIFQVVFWATTFLPLSWQNTIHNGIQGYINYQGPQYQTYLDIDMVDVMNNEPHRCLTSADCELFYCGTTRSCTVAALNKVFIEHRSEEILNRTICQNENDIELRCDQITDLQAYTDCENAACVVKTLLQPTTD